MADDVSAIVARHGGDATRLVQILRDVGSAHGWITPGSVTAVARALNVERTRVEGVAGFYSFLDTEPCGRYHVRFSDNVTDVMAGAAELRERMLESFRVELGEVSRDGAVRFDLTSCTGLCDQGPAMLVNGRAIPRLTPARIGAISALIRGGSPVEEWPENLFTIHAPILRRDLILGTPLDPGEAIRATVARGAIATLQEVKRSGLRGRGGAGFSAGMKWEACREAPGQDRVVVCNADEGEPGTFKDRVLLSDFADLVVEGMTVAAHVAGARRGFIYLRAEYPFLVPHIEEVLARRRRALLLGPAIGGEAGFDFDIELRVGAGAYVCGEETALLESLEGKRGIPRSRPPYPVTHGYLGSPTIVNNVETLAAAALVAVHGGDWWRSRGTPKSAGTKVLSVSGDVARPGVYEFPFGVTVREVLEAAGAVDAQAVQVGGPSGTLLAARERERRIAFEDVPCAGAVMVFDGTRDVVDVARNFARFFAHESCGFCTPCRVGTTVVARTIDRITTGAGTRSDLDDLGRIAGIMKAASHCGLGATAGNPVVDAIARFRPAFERRIAPRGHAPSFDVDQALAPAREATGRDDAQAHFSEEAP